jgi:predicted ABC-type ATPase
MRSRSYRLTRDVTRDEVMQQTRNDNAGKASFLVEIQAPLAAIWNVESKPRLPKKILTTHIRQHDYQAASRAIMLSHFLISSHRSITVHIVTVLQMKTPAPPASLTRINAVCLRLSKLSTFR